MHLELRPKIGPAGRAAAAGARGRPRLRRLARVAVLLLGLFALLPPAPVAAQQDAHSAEEIAESRDDILGNGRYQTERPVAEKPPERDPLTIPPWLIKTVLWTAGIVVAAMVLYFLFNLARDLLDVRFGRKQRPAKPAAEAPRIETVPPAQREAERRTLAEADALAAEGRFSEAIHLLLLVAMERLRRELGPRVAPAMTSREVLRLSPIPENVTAPLTRMVALSEIKHFGGRAADEPDYRICREDFLRFNGMEPAPA